MFGIVNIDDGRSYEKNGDLRWAEKEEFEGGKLCNICDRGTVDVHCCVINDTLC